jgi:hypothetical protein
MKAVAVARYIGPGLGLAGSQSSREISDGVVRVEPFRSELQQTDTPSVRVAVVFEAEEIAVQGVDIDSSQHWLGALEDLVVCSNAYSGEVLTSVDLASSDDRFVEDVVYGPDREV